MVIAPSRPWRFVVLILLACLPILATAQEPEQEAFIELSASNDEVYVQQQLLLTVKLYYSTRIIQGQLSDPEHPDAVIEKLGEQKQYQERINGERYRVVERDYVIFPQKPGRLQLPPLDFQGMARHPRGHHYRISDSAVLFAVNVKDVPAGFSGDTWLPATDLSLSASGLQQIAAVKPGDNLTRTLRVTAQGLPGSTLPLLDIDYPDAIRSYPEPEQRDSSVGTDGVVGELQQTVALVPVSGQGEEIILPEVRIPWWDVNEDREKVAILPARTIQLRPGSQPAPQSGIPSAQVAANEPQPKDPEPASSVSSHWIWPLVVGLLLLGWATTAAAWWIHSQRQRARISQPTVPDRENDRFQKLCEQARELDPAFFNGFPAWAQSLTAMSCRTSDDALRILSDRDLSRIVNDWRETLFGNAGGPGVQGKDLGAALKTARNNWLKGNPKGRRASRQDLPDLYPEGLRP